MDIYYRREKKRVGGDHRAKPDEFRLEKTRFLVLPPMVGSVSFVPALIALMTRGPGCYWSRVLD
jgi:hypothetical protein